MSEPDRETQERASNRELMWMVIGALFAGGMIAVAIVVASRVG